MSAIAPVSSDTAEYLICGDCGVYVAAMTRGLEEPRSIVIVNALNDSQRFTQPPLAMDYDQEDRAARMLRRKSVWMPGEVNIDHSAGGSVAV